MNSDTETQPEPISLIYNALTKVAHKADEQMVNFKLSLTGPIFDDCKKILEHRRCLLIQAHESVTAAETLQELDKAVQSTASYLRVLQEKEASLKQNLVVSCGVADVQEWVDTQVAAQARFIIELQNMISTLHKAMTQ